MYDIVIIGSGPAGLSAAVYAKRAGLSVVIVEKTFYGTGQVAESSQVDNYLGLPETNGFDLGEKFRSHAENFGTEFITGEAVGFEKKDNTWIVKLKDESTLETKTVIYAAGAVHRHLGIPGENDLSAKGVSYCATCDGSFFRGRTVAVVGGGDTALDDALYLSKLAAKVYVVHRRDEFRGSKSTVEKLKAAENVELVLSAVPSKVCGEDSVTGLTLADGRTLEVDGVFIAVGMIPLTKIVDGVVELDEAGYIKADETCVTSEAGFYAAGDVRTKSLRQVVTAVADGACAVTSAEHYINND
ncbi:MAG: FAD-dependent oxidoreductase [Lachnospiraceae bacterium]|nr:FAD-dependent oxidoreductase [Lachnospiraceae bacterium]